MKMPFSKESDGFLSKAGQRYNPREVHMLGVGLIFCSLMFTVYEVTGSEIFIMIDAMLVASAYLVDVAPSKWMEKHKANAHYMMLGHLPPLIIYVVIIAWM